MLGVEKKWFLFFLKQVLKICIEHLLSELHAVGFTVRANSCGNAVDYTISR